MSPVLEGARQWHRLRVRWHELVLYYLLGGRSAIVPLRPVFALDRPRARAVFASGPPVGCRGRDAGRSIALTYDESTVAAPFNDTREVAQLLSENYADRLGVRSDADAIVATETTLCGSYLRAS